MDGIIKALVRAKSYGFVIADGKDIFFHASAVVNRDFDNLRSGDTVTFDLGQNSRGAFCENLVDTSPLREAQKRGTIWSVHDDYCVIQSAGRGRIFAHKTDFDRTVDESDLASEVEFDTITTDKGLACCNVRVLSEPIVKPPVKTPTKGTNQGTITKLSCAGYGFINGSIGSTFFHKRDVDRDFDLLEVGDEATFDIATGKQGPECRNVSSSR